MVLRFTDKPKQGEKLTSAQLSPFAHLYIIKTRIKIEFERWIWKLMKYLFIIVITHDENVYFCANS